MLVPAAIGNVINSDTAESIDAKYVVEAANGPTTPEGDAILRKRGITVLPDIYTNGGKTLQDTAAALGSANLYLAAKVCNCKYVPDFAQQHHRCPRRALCKDVRRHSLPGMSCGRGQELQLPST